MAVLEASFSGGEAPLDDLHHQHQPHENVGRVQQRRHVKTSLPVRLRHKYLLISIVSMRYW